MSYASSKRGDEEYAQADRDTIKLLSQRAQPASQEAPSDDIRLEEQTPLRADEREDARRS